MIEIALVVVGFSFGVYAGKRRAKGYTWRMVADDVWFRVASVSTRMWNGVVSTFRRDKDVPDLD